MFEGMTYQELNDLIENPRSEPYETYFGDMDITDEEKEKRISLAEKFEDNIRFVLILLFTMQQYGQVDWEVAREQFEIRYRNAINGYVGLDEYMEIYIRTFSYDVIDATQSHEDDPYYYSTDRLRLISENESQGSMNHQQFTEAVNSGKTMKQWVDVGDRKERETHRKVGGSLKPIQDPFIVGNSLMMYPKDAETFGAEAKEIINCRCSIRYF